MNLAITIGAYQLTEFVELNLAMLRQIFGNDVPILVSDDHSVKSPAMHWLAGKYGAEYIGSSARRNHFAGDAQAAINALAFAKANDCEVAVKLSQRVVLTDPDARATLLKPFENGYHLAMPGRLNVNKLRPEHRMYASFMYLTDLVAVRVSELSAEELMRRYQEKVKSCATRTDAYVERLFLELARKEFDGKTWVYPEYTDHYPGQPCKFLRKCQNDQIQYQKLGHTKGIHGMFSVSDWRFIDPDYRPHPKVV